MRPHEYIVVDGGSTDGTVELIKANADMVDRWVSEKDKGIYDAMNKAVSMATGDYIYFLNAGDAFIDADVLRDVQAAIQVGRAPDLLFGSVIYQKDNWQARRRFAHINRWSMPFADLCHQAIFARRDLFSRVGGFNLEFRFAADFDWLIRAFSSGAVGRYIDRDIGLYDASGLSARHADAVEREKQGIALRYLSVSRYKLGRFIYKACRKVFNVGLPIELKHD